MLEMCQDNEAQTQQGGDSARALSPPYLLIHQLQTMRCLPILPAAAHPALPGTHGYAHHPL